jgi:hypothetical protein
VPLENPWQLRSSRPTPYEALRLRPVQVDDIVFFGIAFVFVDGLVAIDPVLA